MYLQGETEEKLFVIVAFLFFPSTLYKTKLTSHDFVCISCLFIKHYFTGFFRYEDLVGSQNA